MISSVPSPIFEKRHIRCLWRNYEDTVGRLWVSRICHEIMVPSLAGGGDRPSTRQHGVLLMPQGLDGVQAGSLTGREIPEDDAHRTREQEGHCHDPRVEDEGQV